MANVPNYVNQLRGYANTLVAARGGHHASGVGRFNEVELRCKPLMWIQ
jgi:hypothetical protein